MQTWPWRVLPVAQKKHDQPIRDVQTKLSKNAFLENKQTKKQEIQWVWKHLNSD